MSEQLFTQADVEDAVKKAVAESRKETGKTLEDVKTETAKIREEYAHLYEDGVLVDWKTRYEEMQAEVAAIQAEREELEKPRFEAQRKKYLIDRFMLNGFSRDRAEELLSYVKGDIPERGDKAGEYRIDNEISEIKMVFGLKAGKQRRSIFKF